MRVFKERAKTISEVPKVKSSESESSSQMLSDEKDKAFSREDVTVIKEYEMSSSQQIFPSCQTGLNSKKKKKDEEEEQGRRVFITKFTKSVQAKHHRSWQVPMMVCTPKSTLPSKKIP